MDAPRKQRFPRDILQMTAIYRINNCTIVLYALADDGTLWCRADIEGGDWRQIPPLPSRST